MRKRSWVAFLLILALLVLSVGCKPRGDKSSTGDDQISISAEEEEQASLIPDEESLIKEIYGEGYEVINGMSDLRVDCSASGGSNFDLYPDYDADEGCYLLYLPSNVDKGDMTVRFESDGPVFVNGKWVRSGEATDAFSKQKNKVSCGDYKYIFRIISPSASVGAMYIQTESGSLDYVLEDKSHKEEADMLYINGNGDVKYDGALDYIKGRGNYSWIDLAKKPFNIKLDKKTDLIGSGKSKKFCLIANHQDDTLVRNKSIYDLSGKLGLYYSQSEFADLYINGHYYGLFQITDKVEIGAARIDVTDLDDQNELANPGVDFDRLPLKGYRNADASYQKGSVRYVDVPNEPTDVTGGYLMEFDIAGRYEEEISGFVSDGGQSIALKSPEYASFAEITYISTYYDQFEKALASGSGYNDLGKHFTDYIDVDSFALNYIIAELTRNTDAGITSFFIYKGAGEKMVCAPVWDFDNSLYNNNDYARFKNGETVELFAATRQLQDMRGGRKDAGILTLYGQLYDQPVFRKRVAELWKEKVVPLMPEFIQSFYDNASRMTASIIKNAIRWNIYGTDDAFTITSAVLNRTEVYGNVLGDRLALLGNYYLTDGCGVYYFANGGENVTTDTVTYRAGDTVKLKNNGFKYQGKKFKGWNTLPDGTGASYSERQSVTLSGDLVLYAIWE